MHVTLCDLCGKEINTTGSTYRRVEVKRSAHDTPQRVFDMHEKCCAAMIHWINDSKEKASKFKDVK